MCCPQATHVMEHAEHGYTTNIPLADITTDEAIVAYAYEGEEIEPIHGGPVRIVVPHLYFWKSAKWVRALELRDATSPASGSATATTCTATRSSSNVTGATDRAQLPTEVTLQRSMNVSVQRPQAARHAVIHHAMGDATRCESARPFG